MINLDNKTNNALIPNTSFLKFAMEEGNAILIRNYLKKTSNISDTELTAALHFAISKEKMDCALALIEFGADPFTTYGKDGNAFTHAHSLEATKSMLYTYLEKKFPIQNELIKELISTTSVVALQFLSQIDSQELEKTLPYSSTISNFVLGVCLIFNTSKLVKQLIKNFDPNNLLLTIPHIFPLATIFVARKFPLAACFTHLLPAWLAIHTLLAKDIPQVIKEFKNNNYENGLLRGLISGLKTTAAVLPLFYAATNLKQKTAVITPQQAHGQRDHEITFYLFENHASVYIKDSLNTTTHAGFGPMQNLKNASPFAITGINAAANILNIVQLGPLSNIFTPLLPCPGAVWDESKHTREYSNTAAHLEIKINSIQAKAALNYIETVQRDCPDGPKCIYNSLSKNCIDFAQEIYKRIGFAGHFTQHLTESKQKNGSSHTVLAHAYVFVKESINLSTPALLKPTTDSEAA